MVTFIGVITACAVYNPSVYLINEFGVYRMSRYKITESIQDCSTQDIKKRVA